MNIFNFNQKGSALFLSIVLLSVILAIALGLGAIVAIQARTLRGIGDSVIAFYAADAGIEQVLKIVVSEKETLSEEYNGKLSNASYKVQVKCCKSGTGKCLWDSDNNCPSGLEPDPNCQALRYCIDSVGAYQNTKRAIEVEI